MGVRPGGISSKVDAVKQAVTSIGSAITGAFDSKMEVHSPSKVMQRRANYVIDPLVDVPARRAGEVRAAIGGLGNLDAPGALPGGAGGGGTYHVTNNFYGVKDADDVKRGLDEWWATKMLGEARGNALVPT